MVKKVTTVIVDDEPLACQRLSNLLDSDSEIEIVAVCQNGKDAIKEINNRKPDLVFLDIQMPEIDGFDVIKKVETNGYVPVVIFVTAYDEYALKAFEVHAQDYLLKPFDSNRFETALQRAKTVIKSEEKEPIKEQFEQFIDGVSTGRNHLSRLMVKSSGRYTFLKINEVDWFEASGNYVRIHAGGKTHLIRETMINLESRLDPDLFFRIHRSYIVNVEKIREIEQWFHGDYMVMLDSGEKLTMSRNYKDLLQKF